MEFGWDEDQNAYRARVRGLLERTLPHVERATLPGLGHDGPEDDGQPALVAQHLRRFFG